MVDFPIQFPSGCTISGKVLTSVHPPVGRGLIHCITVSAKWKLLLQRTVRVSVVTVMVRRCVALPGQPSHGLGTACMTIHHITVIREMWTWHFSRAYGLCYKDLEWLTRLD